ncbi:LysR family transcriptional regulator [Stenotrophomonas sp. CFBP8980]|jgi:DNA-binding transcriptional LysR family regulator|uniref:LysR family transcriptional regulator n=1 Tax=Stenotrophomonas sp. CFBP8980 TaxID=3096523 RepID=UPI002A69DCE4|nr:LysR family transcriptional regulator [Stenotrophomonas sp. CFBP8980]MDY1035130.1 LysR family transcriptional regulator [Stenotrophomonas sp. CFBP8980]
MNLLQLIRTFTRTAEAGSIAGAARALGISATAVGQNISRLEAHLGVRLFNRSTRSLSLSEAGALYLAKVQHIEAELAGAQAAISSGDIEPAGPLRIGCSRAFGRHVLAPMLPALQRRYPQLQLELRLSDRAVRHAEESVDVSIRIGAQLQDGLVARPLARIPFVFCAAPSYLERAGTPTSPEQLASHRALLFRFPADGRPLRWGLLGEQGRVEATMQPGMICDDIDALAELAAAGGGITRLAAFVAEPYLRDGRLQAVLADDPAWRPEPMEMYFCLSDRRDFTARIRVLFEYLQAGLPVAWQVPAG